MTLPIIAYILLLIFWIIFPIWFYRMMKSPPSFFKGGLDLKHNTNDRLLVISLVVWAILMGIVITR